MASITNVTLTFQNGPVPKTVAVNVGFTLTFDPSEAGKKYHLGVKLFGEDKPNDNLPSADAVGDDEIHVFTWGTFLNKKPFKVITAKAGSQTFNEPQLLTDEALDEDKGNAQTSPVPLMRADELYAVVSLSGAPVVARSATLITPGK